MPRCFRTFKLGILLGLVVPVSAVGQIAEMVWVEASNRQHNIVYSSWDEAQWSDPEIILSSENTIATPVISTQKDGTKMLIWSQYVKRKSLLMSASKDGSESSWGSPTVLSRLGVENVAPSIVRDLAGKLWVFWAADIDSYSDVFFVKQRAGGWSDPVRVHVANEVPDIKPLACLNSQGQVVVSWQSYDLGKGGYVGKETVYRQSVERPLGTAKNSAKLPLSQRPMPSEIELPAFISPEMHATIHLPYNRNRQTVRVTGGSIELTE